MKKIIIIITVVTLAVISIIVFSDKDKFSAIVKRHNAQCEMYNKVCDSEWCEIDSLVRTFPQEYITLTIGEDGKVSEVKVQNDYYGLETMINERIDDLEQTVNNNYNSMYTTSDEKEFNTTLIINNYINTN